MTTTTRDIPAKQSTSAQPLGDLSFIETQFPVSKISKESYAEREAKQSQTLTGLGKWWGRKPLVLCRATILGLLIPATNDPQKDREVFLRLMTMDDDGMLRRKSKRLRPEDVASRIGPTARQRHFIVKKNRKDQDTIDYRPSATTARQRELYRKAFGKPARKADPINATPLFQRLEAEDRSLWFTHDSTESEARFYDCPETELEQAAFLSLTYDERMSYCCRPEQVDGPSTASWLVINNHLRTCATSLSGLVEELGRRRFGHIPRIGDAFCGGGSIPFESARIGCHAYGSDLNPVAALLTWSALNIVGGGQLAADEVREAQREVYKAVDLQITEWGIEHREPDPVTGRRWRADAYLYCVEVTCPECGWRIPLAPSWVVGKGSKTIVQLVPDHENKRFDFRVAMGVSDKDLEAADNAGTARNSELVCPGYSNVGAPCSTRTPIKAIRGDGRGTFGDSNNMLRGWENNDIVPRSDDILGERLYCIRWVDSWTAMAVNSKGEEAEKKFAVRKYLAPTHQDLKRESKAKALLSERFANWQLQGVIPSRRIEPGAKTNEPIRTRGWTYWHQLFNPRQLLINGLFNLLSGQQPTLLRRIGAQLGVGKCLDRNSRLCLWDSSPANEKVANTFLNQALNCPMNYGSRTVMTLDTTWFYDIRQSQCVETHFITSTDARTGENVCDIWITDPPYADAVSYHELSEFFLSWYANTISREFPGWTNDSRRALAVTGSDSTFSESMVACYRKMASQMPINGFQVVMFTHQDASVWATLALILWASGLKVCSAWCIATETDSALKDGNYVQGTVLLVLRKQAANETAFLDEVYQEVEVEVHRQLNSMKDLDDARDPNFRDTDYQLAAYAAALRVLTSKQIEEIDVAYELTRTRTSGETSPIEEIIEKAVQIACDHLVPIGLEPHVWKSLTSQERLYAKGLELESHGEYRSGVYQELSRGFGVEQYINLLASTKANETRLKTATEFGRRELGDSGFGATLLRQVLFAVHRTRETEGTGEGITWLKTEVPDYASNRQRVIELLEYLAAFRKNASMTHWHVDSDAAALLAGALRNRADNV